MRKIAIQSIVSVFTVVISGAAMGAEPWSNPPCRVDPSYVSVAKATGGTVFCRPASGAAVDDDAFQLMTSGFRIQSYRFEFKARWKVLGHGSMDSYTYTWSKLPLGPVTLQIVNFPVKLATVDTLVAFNTSGEVSAPAVLLTRMGGGKNEISLETWRFNTLRGDFRIALQGKTRTGTPFVMYSKESAKGSGLGDRASGLAVWADIVSKLGPSVSPARRDQLMLEAFADAP